MSERTPSSTAARRSHCPLCGSTALDTSYQRELGEAAHFGLERLVLDLCKDCGLLFQNPPPAPAVLAEHYRASRNASGTVWHEGHEGTLRHGFKVGRARFARHLLDRPPARILDVGCGWGEFLGELADLGAERSGLEPNPHAARHAREQGIEVVEALLEDCDLPAASFDLVTCISCLEHASSIHDFTAALARLVTPGGVVFLEVPDSCRPIAQAAEFYSIEHLTHFTSGTLYRLLLLHGFAPFVCERLEGLPGLRIGARRVTSPGAAGIVVPDDRVELREALRTYARDRARLMDALQGRLGVRLTRWRDEGRRVAVYGAGDHTRFLFDVLPLAERTAVVLDGDPAKDGATFQGLPVRSPEAVVDWDVAAVVLSSQPFQEEMAARIAPLCAAHGIEVVRCYDERIAAA